MDKINVNIDEINCFYLCNCSEKNIQDDSFDDACKLVIAASNEYKELILICEGCYKFFCKDF